MTRWTFDNPRATIEQSTGHSRLHRVPGAVEAVLAETLPSAQCSARWWSRRTLTTLCASIGDGAATTSRPSRQRPASDGKCCWLRRLSNETRG